MVEVQLPYSAEPMQRIHGRKQDNVSGEDTAPGSDFSAAVSLDAPARNAGEALSRQDQPVEILSLDPELDADQAVAALSQAVAVYIAFEIGPATPSHSPGANGPDGLVLKASPVARLRAALPGLTGMASVSTGAQEPGGPDGSRPGTTPVANAAAGNPSAADAQADSATTGDQVGPVPAESLPDRAVQAESFQLPSAAASVAELAITRAMTRAMAAFPADDSARPPEPLQLAADHNAGKPSVIGTVFENAESMPGIGEVRVLSTGTASGRRLPSSAQREAGVEPAGTDRSPVVSRISESAQTQPSLTNLPADAGAAQRDMAQLPQSAAPETELAGRADGGEVTHARWESPPSRPASEIGFSLRNPLPAGDAAKPQSGGQVLPSPAATIFFAQMPGLPGSSAESPVEQLRPIATAGPDFSPGVPLRHLEIVLAPPELGTVRVVITREGGEMRVELIASTSQAFDMLESARESMAEAIRDTGLRAGPIEVRQDLQAARPTGAGDFPNGSAWNGKHEQGRQQAPENWQATRGQSYAQAVRNSEKGIQNQGLIL
jgi:flagellar hook-length control protein FliK